MNLFQQIGVGGVVGGGIIGFWRVTGAPLPNWAVGGGEMLVKLPPDYVIWILLIGGAALFVLGTGWKAIRRSDERKEEYEEHPPQ